MLQSNGILQYESINDSYIIELQALWSDEEVIRYTNIVKPSAKEEVIARINIFQRSDVFVILKDGEFVGIIGCPKVDQICTEFGLFYQIRKCFWGRGYASMATEWMLKYMFQKYHELTIYADVIVDNMASEKILKHFGFSLVSETECIHKCKNVKIHNFDLKKLSADSSV